jgi:hypothetical protein
MSEYHPLKTMIIQPLDMDKDMFRPKEEDEETLGGRARDAVPQGDDPRGPAQAPAEPLRAAAQGRRRHGTWRLPDSKGHDS